MDYKNDFMKIGIIKHLNARPLTYGFEKLGEHELVYENPAMLVEDLCSGKLDTALISSVEVFRKSKILSYSLSAGVCAEEKVRSIVFYRNLKEKFPPTEIQTDSGSRTSVALLKILLRMETGKDVDTVPTSPEKISESLEKKIGSHLLFGDNALLDISRSDNYEKIDLAEWWHSLTGLPFCFALWAFPKDKQLPDNIFSDSLNYGISKIDEIIENEKRFSKDFTRNYLQKDLHYFLNAKDLEALEFFKKKCEEYEIL